MKSIQNLFCIFLIVVVCSCSKDDNLNPVDDSTFNHNSEITTRSSQGVIYNKPIYSQTELIVKYLPGVPDTIKAFLRSHHDVLYYEICQKCPEKYFELWGFDDDIQIEPRKHAIETFGMGIDDVDNQFEYIAKTDVVDVGSGEDTSYEPLIVSSNSGMTIAILDTGFDPHFPFWYDNSGEPIPMLYNASETADGEELSGWDFIDSDPNPYDDNAGKHGSAITYELHNILINAGVPFQILPLKIFNAEAKTSYFYVLCGTNYALPRADFIQMSFGWYEDGIGDYENSILKSLIEEYDDVIVVTSAGNGDGNDDPYGDSNDLVTHYPSSYDLDNIIAVAATNQDGTAPAEWSNYGAMSVDFWAAGEEVPFYDYDYNPLDVFLQGTSFAAPQITAKGAMFKYWGGGALSPEDVINMINTYGLSTTGYYMENPVKYEKYYPMLVE